MDMIATVDMIVNASGRRIILYVTFERMYVDVHQFLPRGCNLNFSLFKNLYDRYENLLQIGIRIIISTTFAILTTTRASSDFYPNFSSARALLEAQHRLNIHLSYYSNQILWLQPGVKHMLKTLILIFKNMIHIHQKKRNTYVLMEILLQDQGPQIIENKKEESINHSLGGFSGWSSVGWYFSVLMMLSVWMATSILSISSKKWDDIINLNQLSDDTACESSSR